MRTCSSSFSNTVFFQRLERSNKLRVRLRDVINRRLMISVLRISGIHSVSPFPQAISVKNRDAHSPQSWGSFGGGMGYSMEYSPRSALSSHVRQYPNIVLDNSVALK